MALGVDSASNRNEYQETSWGVKGAATIKQEHHHHHGELYIYTISY
jgi:hypothetical protein